jgi:hypothetical protein
MPREVREQKLSVKAARIQKQRTAGGSVNSNVESAVPQPPEKQSIQIRVAKRGDKIVTMVQGTRPHTLCVDTQSYTKQPFSFSFILKE